MQSGRSTSFGNRNFVGAQRRRMSRKASLTFESVCFWKLPPRAGRPSASLPRRKSIDGGDCRNLWRCPGLFRISFSKACSQADRDVPPDSLATRLRLNGSFPDAGGVRHYNVQHVPAGFGLMFGAGALSGLLGIGSGELSKFLPWIRP